MNDLHPNTTKILDHISVCLDRIESYMPSAVVSDKIAQLGTDVNVIMESHNALSNETELRFFIVADRLAVAEQNPVSTFIRSTTAQVPRGCCKVAKKDTCLSDTDSAFSKDLSPSYSGGPRLNRRVSQHRRHSSTDLGRN